MSNGSVGWHPPIPDDEEFIKLVFKEIEEANKRAKETLEQPFEVKKPKAAKAAKARNRLPIIKAKKRENGSCIACGAEYEKYTRGCTNCAHRHASRRRYHKLKKESNANAN